MPSLERLVEVAAYVPWETFEKLSDGHGLLYLPEEDRCYSFYLRVGLYMNRPVQAIIAEGNFIRFRGGKQWEPYQLKSLDPKQPMSSVYFESEYGAMGTAAWPATTPQVAPAYHASGRKQVWDPVNQFTSKSVQLMQHQMQLQQHQYQMQAQQYQNLHTSTLSYPPTVVTTTTVPTNNTAGGPFQSLAQAFANIFSSKSTP